VTRTLRAARVVKYFRDLRVIILSIAHSGKTFFWGLVLMAFMAYLCCVVTLSGMAEYLDRHKLSDYSELDETVRDSILRNWSSLLEAMLTQYRSVTGGGPWGNSVQPVRESGTFYFTIFLLYVAALLMGVMKLLTGIFVQQANLAQKRDRAEFIRESVKQVFNAMDDDESGFVSREEFQACVGFKAAREFLAEMEIRPEDALRLFDMVDDDNSGQIDVDEFINGCQRFSGTAKNFDMAVALLRMEEIGNDLKTIVQHNEKMLSQSALFGSTSPRRFSHEGLERAHTSPAVSADAHLQQSGYEAM